MAERSDKFTYELNPKSGAKIWVKAPDDSHGRRMFPDLHINVDWAEDLILLLMSAIEEAKKQVDS
jgi:hypothetical protein